MMKSKIVSFKIALLIILLSCETMPTISEIPPKTNTKPEKIQQPIPTTFDLGNPYPNPFSSEVNIAFRVPVEAYIILIVQNPVGDIIKTLVSQNLLPGNYVIQWNAQNFEGSQVNEGFYFITMEVINQSYKNSIPIEYKK